MAVAATAREAVPIQKSGPRKKARTSGRANTSANPAPVWRETSHPMSTTATVTHAAK